MDEVTGLVQKFGAAKALALVQKISEHLEIEMIKKIKDSKAYKEEYGTFEKFVTAMGQTPRTMYDKIKKLPTASKDTHAALMQLGYAPKAVMLPGKVDTEVTETGTVKIGDAEIEMNPENAEFIKETLKAVYEDLESAKKETGAAWDQVKELRKELAEIKKKTDSNAGTPGEQVARFRADLGKLQNDFLGCMGRLHALDQLAKGSGNTDMIDDCTAATIWLDTQMRQKRARLLDEPTILDDSDISQGYYGDNE